MARRPSSSRTRLVAKLAAGGSGLVLGLIVLTVVLTMLAPPLAGYERYVVDGDSMSPGIPRGSLAYARTVPVDELRRGDVITYTRPGFRRPTTHRIVDLGVSRGQRWFRTKGDANRKADPGRVSLNQPVQARYSFHVPYVGWAIITLGDRDLRIWVLGLPAILFALLVLRSIWRSDSDPEPVRSEA
jgi:signal peptidase I